MPIGRFPDRVKPFRKWAQEKMDNAQLSESATPHVSKASSMKRGRKWRLRRRKRRNRRGSKD